jgi:hypothetical protein
MTLNTPHIKIAPGHICHQQSVTTVFNVWVKLAVSSDTEGWSASPPFTHSGARPAPGPVSGQGRGRLLGDMLSPPSLGGERGSPTSPWGMGWPAGQNGGGKTQETEHRQSAGRWLVWDNLYLEEHIPLIFGLFHIFSLINFIFISVNPPWSLSLSLLSGGETGGWGKEGWEGGPVYNTGPAVSPEVDVFFHTWKWGRTFFFSFFLNSGQHCRKGEAPIMGLEVGVHSGSVGQGAEATAPLPSGHSFRLR